MTATKLQKLKANYFKNLGEIERAEVERLEARATSLKPIVRYGTVHSKSIGERLKEEEDFHQEVANGAADQCDTARKKLNLHRLTLWGAVNTYFSEEKSLQNDYETFFSMLIERGAEAEILLCATSALLNFSDTRQKENPNNASNEKSLQVTIIKFIDAYADSWSVNKTNALALAADTLLNNYGVSERWTFAALSRLSFDGYRLDQERKKLLFGYFFGVDNHTKDLFIWNIATTLFASEPLWLLTKAIEDLSPDVNDELNFVKNIATSFRVNLPNYLISQISKTATQKQVVWFRYFNYDKDVTQFFKNNFNKNSRKFSQYFSQLSPEYNSYQFLFDKPLLLGYLKAFHHSYCYEFIFDDVTNTEKTVRPKMIINRSTPVLAYTTDVFLELMDVCNAYQPSIKVYIRSKWTEFSRIPFFQQDQIKKYFQIHYGCDSDEAKYETHDRNFDIKGIRALVSVATPLRGKTALIQYIASFNSRFFPMKVALEREPILSGKEMRIEQIQKVRNS